MWELPQERRALLETREAARRNEILKNSHKVPPLCPGGTVVCLGCGPSLVKADVDWAHAKGATIIAVNDAYTLAPFAAALMASDGAWWIHKKPAFAGLRYSLDPSASRVKGVIVLKNTGTDGIEQDPAGLRTGRNSGAAAVNLAVHFGAKRIILIGYDMGHQSSKRSHFFGNHKFPLRDGSPFPVFIEAFKRQVNPLKQLGIEVVNCSRQTALTCFPRLPLEDALP